MPDVVRDDNHMATPDPANSPVERRRGAVITGLGRRRGIAAAVCRALIRDGWKVVACGSPAYDREVEWTDPPRDDIDGFVEELAATGRFLWRPVDLEAPEAATQLLDTAEQALAGVDALVTAHARSLSGGLVEVTAQEFDRHLAVNARATLFLISEFARRWRGQPVSGRIVTFVSGPPLCGEIAYAASKGAIEWLTLSAAAELAPRGITVNAIDPGPTDTGWMSAVSARDIAAASPLGRIGTADDAAELVAFLCSERGGWITGQVIRSDGGWSTLTGVARSSNHPTIGKAHAIELVSRPCRPAPPTRNAARSPKR
jgi:3-oxoacyl-[acyl-carrier protein] reductase